MNRIESLNVYLTKEKKFFTMIQQQKRSTSIFFRDSMHRNRYMQLYIKETDMAKDSLFGNIFNSANLNDQCNRMKQTNKQSCILCTLYTEKCLCCS